ncbi:hypothetical protein TOPH_08565 [Tolypocladium ophioglossoides CBS 100239]|uniref:Uncharacterized protein n=1 Tax=Tolypocladium ophioglossoides (strain CBS 100239) TaxID=1163406 RepID=A0A0L0MY97_TOLOC|nr:hypothetical protein TOPH_08565 [Tolypocladium ophioglossoides CBS 100239]
MDFVKKTVDGGTGAGSGENKEQKPQAGQAKDGQQEDYVDKVNTRDVDDRCARSAFDFASKKSGHNLDRNTQEKITDSGRSAYEKATGNKVNPKISN